MTERQPQAEDLVFASRTIWEQLTRGVIGIGAFTCAVLWTASYPWLAWLAIPVGVLAFRGCPMCWTVGLVMTIVAKVQGRPAADNCSRGCDRKDSGPGGVRV